jgi:hypothetical protein
VVNVGGPFGLKATDNAAPADYPIFTHVVAEKPTIRVITIAGDPIDEAPVSGHAFGRNHETASLSAKQTDRRIAALGGTVIQRAE